MYLLGFVDQTAKLAGQKTLLLNLRKTNLFAANIEVDSHSAGALAIACKDKYLKAVDELELLKRFRDKDPNVLRCCLPSTLCNCTYEEIVEQIDPWCSLVMFWEHWEKTFAQIAEQK